MLTVTIGMSPFPGMFADPAGVRPNLEGFKSIR
jgi:hypothetical protein